MKEILETLDLNLVEERYGSDLIDDICFTRRIALEIDKDPTQISKYRDESTIVRLCNEQDPTCLSKTKQAEALAYGDASVFVGCPGPSLAGGAMREMGDEEKQRYFFEYVAENRCTTFAGITEPKHGSDVAGIETKLEKIDNDMYSITGEKCFISHGADAMIGVVVARTSDGPFGITGVLVTAEDIARGEHEGTINREFLPIVGMKGTCLSRISLQGFRVPAWNVLGLHLRLIGRGMLAVIKTFNLMRPCVSGFVLGQAQAIIDYVNYCFKPLPKNTQRRLSSLNADLACARENLFKAAEHIQRKPLEPSQVSLAKAQITSLTEQICSVLSDELDAAQYCEHPLLLKWARDVYGFEYMEGTTNMQKRNVYQKHLRTRT